MRRIVLSSLIAVLVLSLALVGWATAGPETEAAAGFGNHTLNGAYEFHADGVVEVNGVPTSGIWEVGRFNADGKGNITDGVEYSSLLSSSDEATIDQSFTFSGTYTVNPDGTATGEVTVVVAPGVEITKKLWLIIHSVGKNGIANGFDGGHAHADLGNGVHGNARSHVGHRIEIAK